MKRLSTFIFIFLTSMLFAQHSILNDSLSPSGKIIQRIKIDGVEPITLISAGSKIQGYKICERFIEDIDILNKSLSPQEIETLFQSDHGTLKVIGFILFAKRHNRKKPVVDKLYEVFKQKHSQIIIVHCSSKAFYTLSHFDYDLLMQENIFFKPKFKLSEKEKKKIKMKIREFEPNY